jgi:hypothetical protein
MRFVEYIVTSSEVTVNNFHIIALQLITATFLCNCSKRVFKLSNYYAANKISFKDLIEFGYSVSGLAKISEGAGPHCV